MMIITRKQSLECISLQYFGNNPILKSQDYTPHLPTLKAYPTPGEVVGSFFSPAKMRVKDVLQGTRSNFDP